MPVYENLNGEKVEDDEKKKKNFLNNSENSLAGKEQQVNSITVQQLYST